MEDLKQQFQEETKLSFDDIPINGVHLEYINWLEKRIKALSLADVVEQSEQLKTTEKKPFKIHTGTGRYDPSGREVM